MKITKLSVAMLGLLGLASCSADMDSASSTRGEVRFSGSTGSMIVATQRTSDLALVNGGTNWSSSDAIGVFMVSHGTTNVKNNASNKKYVAESEGAMTNFMAAGADNVIYYPSDNSAVDFVAYYPWETGKKLSSSLDSEKQILLRINGTDNSATTDLLYAKADNSGTGYKRSTGGAVSFQFKHMLSKITLNCKADANSGLSNLDAMSVSIKDANTLGFFNLDSGKWDDDSTLQEQDITPRKLPTAASGYTVSYEAVVIPGEAEGVTVEFMLNGGKYVGSIPTITLEPGKQYVYPVTLKRTSVELKNGSITDWTEETKNEVIAE